MPAPCPAPPGNGPRTALGAVHTASSTR